MDGSFPTADLDVSALDWALDAIPPAFPLAAAVAVNPVLGFARQDLAETSAILERVAGARLTAPRTWYGRKIAAGEIEAIDLAEALAEGRGEIGVGAIAGLRAAATRDRPAPAPLPLISDLAADQGWSGFVAERLSIWAAGYFDQGQVLWAAPRDRDAFADWRAFASHDRAPDLAGLGDFRAHVAGLDPDPRCAIRSAGRVLGLGPDGRKAYFLRLLCAMGGWSQVAAHARWIARRDGRADATLEGLLAARLAWELYFHRRLGSPQRGRWAAARARYDRALTREPDAEIDGLLHQAYEGAARRGLARRLGAGGLAPRRDGTRPALQAVFCIDVRSEVLRRHLEAQDPGVVTLGFAGFFGVGVGFASEAASPVEHRLPVLLRPRVGAHAADLDSASAAEARLDGRAARAVERFKTGAVAAFAFVESLGWTSAKGLLGRGHRTGAAAKPVLDASVSLEARVAIARGALTGMTLTRDFAPVVLIVGHGAKVRNNPHASALQCGACGGHAGDVNARLLADLLNDEGVRRGLAAEGLSIPADTRFLAALHDTTCDAVERLDGEAAASVDPARLEVIEAWLAAASQAARRERAKRRPGAATSSKPGRAARDFAEARPEWGLAGCHGFIVAPRERTRGLDLDGAVFLHDYDRRQDPDFAGLEAILTAPVVVASWINLAYFGARVAPDLFGGGDKLLHNVVGGLAVGEGRDLTPRPGPPWQSLRAETDIHPPRRLVVAVDASTRALDAVLDRQPDLKAWFQSGWLSLTAFDDGGALAHRWTANGWKPLRPALPPVVGG